MTEEATPSQTNSRPSLQQQQQLNQLQCKQESLPYKNRLQEFTQRAKISFPVYHTVNEGPTHAPKFRSTAEVDGSTYTSLNAFSSRRAAEQGVAKVALEGISKKINNLVSSKMNDDGFPPIFEEKVICKLILHEFAAKMNLEKPKYSTVKFEGGLPGFVSSIVFGGLTYTGEACKSKKEAEQCAAREVILSILGNLGLGTILPEIVKSKANCFSALYKQRCPGVVANVVPPKGLESGNSTAAPETSEEAPGDKDTNKAGNLIGDDVQDAPHVELESGNDTTVPETKEEVAGDRDTNKAGDLVGNDVPDAPEKQTSDVQLLQVQPSLEILDCSKKRKRPKRKKKANKKLKTEVVPDLIKVEAISEGAT